MDASFTLPPLRDVIAQYGLHTKKSLGQHFLLDSNLTDKIVRLAGDLTGCAVIEVGPGPGGLTRSLLHSKARQVVALEKDDRCIAALASLCEASQGRLSVQQRDALEVACTQIADAPRTIIANLPYNVGTQMLVNWLHELADDSHAYTQLLLMFQKEVAERICAAPSTKAYGRISVLAQWLCEVRMVMQVPAAAFSPPPKVDSAIVQLLPRAQPAPVSRDALEKVVATAFQQRRKMLRSALSSLGQELVQQLPELQIAPTARPDQLSVEDYVRLARCYMAL